MTLATARKLSLRANAAATLEKPQTLTPKKLGYTMPGKLLAVQITAISNIILSDVLSSR